VARVFVADYPILLLDEPTASLDAVCRLAVVELIREARAGGAAVLGIVHDAEVRAQVATRVRTMAGTETA
jgi:alpha-D-ribose 1-methylphosphonate 5-triphosphate synthase subunit PhnL